MKITRLWLRSITGQLTLLALAYAGAVVLAIVALCLRGMFFERYIGETYAAAPDELIECVQAASDGTANERQLRKLRDADPKVLYAAWMSDAALDGEGKAARILLSAHGPATLDRIRHTLVLGTLAQRLRALDLLRWAEPGQRAEAAELCRLALQRARRRGEPELARRADDVLTRIEPQSTRAGIP